MNTIRALEYAKRIAYSTEETLMFTYEMAKKYADSPGCYVECGVAAGAQIIAMAAGAPKKRIYALDSFEGIPLPSNQDNQIPGIRMLSEDEQSKLPNPGEQALLSSGATSVSIEDFWYHVNSSGACVDNMVSVKGWFEETVPLWKEINKQPISILRLDGDLYNSTLVCLQNLYPLVARGGIVIIDDWELPGCRNAVLSYLALQKNAPFQVPIFKFISNIAYWIKS